jgi:hypothetical protein
MRKVNKDDEKYLNEINLKLGDFKCELFIDGESRKNSTANPGDYYGEFSAFKFDYDEKINNITVIFILIILLF